MLTQMGRALAMDKLIQLAELAFSGDLVILCKRFWNLEYLEAILISVWFQKYGQATSGHTD